MYVSRKNSGSFASRNIWQILEEKFAVLDYRIINNATLQLISAKLVTMLQIIE